jgi:formylglycine-generating enzyme required for sulfatase activity
MTDSTDQFIVASKHSDVRPWDAAIQRVSDANKANFLDLVRIAGLDPAQHFRLADWSGVSFANLDLAGFDFTGARLHGCNFTNAKIASARFDHAELGKVTHQPHRDPCLPALTTPVANLHTAADWPIFSDPHNWHKQPQPPRHDYLPVGAIFQDAPFAPQMVVVPPGAFMMGTSEDEIDAIQRKYGHDDHTHLALHECPQHEVYFHAPFAVGRFAVTFDEWAAFAQRKNRPTNESLRRGRHPVTNINWDDAIAYIDWLTDVTGKSYHLLSEAQWEYCCRAGTTTAYNTGNEILTSQAQFGREHTIEVGSFPSNSWGLHEIHGNVREWCWDEWADAYEATPYDGFTRRGSPRGGSRVARGGSCMDGQRFLRSASRNWFYTQYSDKTLGLRVARSIAG